MRKLKIKKAGGFITIEFALLIPALLMTCFFLILIGLFQYNRCILELDTRLLAAEALHAAPGEGRRTIELCREKESGLSGSKFILTEDVTLTYRIQGISYRITGSLKQKNPFAVYSFGKSDWQADCTVPVVPVNGREALFLTKIVLKRGS